MFSEEEGGEDAEESNEQKITNQVRRYQSLSVAVRLSVHATGPL